jgi:hypothetical protein
VIDEDPKWVILKGSIDEDGDDDNIDVDVGSCAPVEPLRVNV